MFMKTMAVGPFDPVASCVTGGTTVASPDFCCTLCARKLRAAGLIPEQTLLRSRPGIMNGLRSDIGECRLC